MYVKFEKNYSIAINNDPLFFHNLKIMNSIYLPLIILEETLQFYYILTCNFD